MEHASKSKPLLPAILVLAACLLLPLVSSAPLSRSMSLRKNQLAGSGLEVPAHQGVVVRADQEPNHGEVVVAARMDIEVNDYPGSGANNRHEPRSPGRV